MTGHGSHTPSSIHYTVTGDIGTEQIVFEGLESLHIQIYGIIVCSHLAGSAHVGEKWVN